MKNLTAAILLLFNATLLAQSPSFGLEADTNTILIGEQVKLKLNATIAASEPFQWPVLPDTISRLVLVEVGPLDTVEMKETLQLQQLLTITSFDSGTVAVPALQLKVGNDSAFSEPLAIEVGLPEVADDENFYDIKAPLDAPFSLWDYAYWLLLPALILLVGLLVWWFIKRREGQGSPAKKEPALPPYDLAMRQLQELEDEKLWQDGKVKLYYSRLVDVLRIYLEREFAIKAMESTAGEVAQKINRFSLPELSDLQNMLATSAMVKYARENPLPEENRRALELVRIFVDRTHVKPKEEKPSV